MLSVDKKVFRGCSWAEFTEKAILFHDFRLV